MHVILPASLILVSSLLSACGQRTDDRHTLINEGFRVRVASQLCDVDAASLERARSAWRGTEPAARGAWLAQGEQAGARFGRRYRLSHPPADDARSICTDARMALLSPDDD